MIYELDSSNIVFNGKDFKLINGLDKLFSYLIKEEDNSLFVTQLTNSSNWNYSYALRIVKTLIQGFREL